MASIFIFAVCVGYVTRLRMCVHSLPAPFLTTHLSERPAALHPCALFRVCMQHDIWIHAWDLWVVCQGKNGDAVWEFVFQKRKCEMRKMYKISTQVANYYIRVFHEEGSRS